MTGDELCYNYGLADLPWRKSSRKYQCMKYTVNTAGIISTGGLDCVLDRVYSHESDRNSFWMS